MLDFGAVLFLQINDFYHIDYLLDPTNSDSMVLPRLATIRTRLRKMQEEGIVDRVFFCLPGDFLNPSCLSRRFHSRQMVDLLNSIGVDYVTFGNHEFDFESKPGFTPERLLQRIRQSEFEWIGTNFEFAQNRTAKQFEGHPRFSDYLKVDFSEDQSLVMLGLLYGGEFKPFGKALDPVIACPKLITQLREHWRDQQLSFVALTHQSLEEDKQLADACPEIELIMGGHDHDVEFQAREDRTLIVKTKSNARTVRLNWFVVLSNHTFEAWTQQAQEIRPDLVLDPFKAFVMSQFIIPAIWLAMIGETKRDRSHPLFSTFQEFGYNKGFIEGTTILRRRVGEHQVLVFSVALDAVMPDFWKLIPEQADIRAKIMGWAKKYPSGSQTVIVAPTELGVADEVARSQSTNFGNFVADVVRGRDNHLRPPRQCADIGLVNGGCFRLGRNVMAGETITRRTLCDILFHANAILEYSLSGQAVQNIIEQSLRLRNEGGVEGHGDFLQISGIEVDTLIEPQPGIVFIDATGDRRPLKMDSIYTVATTQYVAEKSKSYRTFFKDYDSPESGEQKNPVEPSIRNAVERELKEAAAFDPDPANRWIFSA